ncbi:MAG: cephalosporin hydroxylase family protein [Hyphomicrobiales bacterium]|nr:cephalosporin hydroxylase family protein [Hyphomicrobiales bacterium]
MKLVIDSQQQTIEREDGSKLPLYSDEAFRLLSHIWMKVGWNQKADYTFSWFGVPVIQLPHDVMRYQEAVWAVQPDVIIETGVAHGGSLVLSASLCKAMGKGRVIGVDIEIRPPNRKRLESHPLFPLITLIEGSSVAPDIVAKVKSLVKPDEKVLVVLDSDHSYRHVMAELEAYAPMVSKGSYIVSTDGVMRDLVDVPRGRKDWLTDNPANAAEDFAGSHKNFVIEEPAWPFNESTLSGNITHWPSAWLKRID